MFLRTLGAAHSVGFAKCVMTRRYRYTGRGVQATAHRLHAAQDGYERSPTQNREFTENLYFSLSVFISVCVFNVWPKITLLLLPVWPRNARMLDIHYRVFSLS